MVMDGNENGNPDGNQNGNEAGSHKQASSRLGEPAWWLSAAVEGLGGPVALGAGVRLFAHWGSEAGLAGVAVEPDLAFVHSTLVGHPAEAGDWRLCHVLLQRHVAGFLLSGRGGFFGLYPGGRLFSHPGIAGIHRPEGPAIASFSGHRR